jgi:hypothetical protein|tara:strand:+ start:2124 stop:2744 length:621 start_codon:yes stop_codon:yes gene_type:complete
MKKHCHAFNVDEATKYGVEQAILLQHLRFWICQNVGKETHTHIGKTWMYQTASDMHNHFPYFSRQKISRLLREMENKGIIQSGNFNKSGYDQTKWYTINIECSELNNAYDKIKQPIPYNNQDNKTDSMFEECWVMYGRKGNKKMAYRYWSKLSDADKVIVKKNIPSYINSRERIYRKDFQGWINPTNEIFKDEIVVKEEQKERVSI